MQQYQIMTFPRLLLGSQIDQNSEEELVFFFGILECRHIFCVNIIWPSVSVWRVLHQTCTGFTIYGDWKCLIKRIKAIFKISFYQIQLTWWNIYSRVLLQERLTTGIGLFYTAMMQQCLFAWLALFLLDTVCSRNIFNVTFYE